MTYKLPLVLLPGTLCDHRLWSAQVKAFSPERRVIVCPLGQKPSIEAEVVHLLAGLPPRFFLAGFSLGGIVALEFYRRAPERIAGIGLVASNARPDPEANRQTRTRQSARALRGDLDGLLRDELLPHYLSEYCERSAELHELIVAMAHASASRFAHQTNYARCRADSRPMLSSIDVPALLVYGEEDRVSPLERQVEMKAALLHAISVAIPRCGHFVPLEAADLCTDAMNRWMSVGQR
ncbi:alpha/beta hydrolase [Caballeronia sp. INDeC2]|uniref:alpha/beta fold hydrolase n=1 Tax=Caballeronia sp. INDeC2 TaxID=2921747 RepID=UPI002028106A|nr:alpha/beta hydrolase [Caballeronia sp. INDeC2]